MKLLKKTSILTILLSLPFITFSQSGSTCTNAINVTIAPVCNYSSYTTSGTEYWLSFVATSPTVNISLITTKYGIDAPHIHALNLFAGTCGSLNLVDEDELPFYDEAKELNIDLNASNLVIGQIYFIRADREAVLHECTRTQCKLNGSTNPTTFELCIKDINVVIPPDFLGEKPVTSLALETNRGQLIYSDGTPADEVVMYNERTDPALYICKDHVSYVHHGVFAGDTSRQRIDMSFEGANDNYDIFKTEQVAGITNYYLPHIPDGVLRNKSYSRVVSNDIYPNIDLQHYSNIAGMKNYYVVRPGGNFEDIVMKFDGATSIIIDNDNLNIVSELGTIYFEKPHVYYVNPGGQIVNMPFDVVYELVGPNKVKFTIQNYPSPQPMTLVIQMDQGHKPGVPKNINNLLWSTYYGGVDLDRIEDLDTDIDGNVYFTGFTQDLTFPAQVQTIVSTNPSQYRMITGAHKPLGETIWSTIFGAQGDIGYSIAVDAFDNVYVGGRNQAALGFPPVQNGFIQIPQTGAWNMGPSAGNQVTPYAIIVKFNRSNGNIIWSTLFGEHTSGAGFTGYAIETDELGNVYLGGTGRRTNFPIVSNGGYSQSTTGISTGFLAKFSGQTNSLEWSTMFGNDFLQIKDIFISSYNEILICGKTSGENLNLFPFVTSLSDDFIQTNFGGGSADAFFAKFDSNSILRWSSLLGGSFPDDANQITISPMNGEIAIVGTTDSPDFPLLSLNDPLVHFSNNKSNYEGFLTVFDHYDGGHPLKYSTYVGSTENDYCSKVKFSSSGRLFISGTTRGSNFPIFNAPFTYNQSNLDNTFPSMNPWGDAFVIVTNPDYQFEWSTLFGGSSSSGNGQDHVKGLSVYNDNILYLGGYTLSENNFPITVDLINSPNAFIQYENSGLAGDTPVSDFDGFISQFDISPGVLGINKNDLEGLLKVYPNPNSGNFYLVGSGMKFNGNVNLSITNVLGQLMYSKQITSTNGNLFQEVILTESPTGIYIINLSFGEKNISYKFIIR